MEQNVPSVVHVGGTKDDLGSPRTSEVQTSDIKVSFVVPCLFSSMVVVWSSLLAPDLMRSCNSLSDPQRPLHDPCSCPPRRSWELSSHLLPSSWTVPPSPSLS